MKVFRFKQLILALFLTAVLVTAGCSSGAVTTGDGLKMVALKTLPKEIREAPETVRESYRFALANPDVLEQIPCYCGCGAVGHQSNYACYVQDDSNPDDIILDGHALGCSICVDITLDTMRMMREGKSTAEIRATIDQTYSKFGPSNIPTAAP